LPSPKLARKTKVAKDNMPIDVNEYILGLDVSVNDSLRVNVFECYELVDEGRWMSEDRSEVRTSSAM
jgi:hypothetical protein